MNLNNDILREMEAEGMYEPKMAFDKVFAIKQEISKEEFMRRLIIWIARNAEIPVEKACFSAIKEEVKEVLVCTAKIQGSGSTEVEYNVRVDNPDPLTYMEVTRSGNKLFVPLNSQITKKETELKDFTISRLQTYSLYNNDKCISSDSIRTAIETANDSSIVAGGDAEVCESALSYAKNQCTKMAEGNYVDYRTRNASFNLTTSVENLVCYKLPVYEVTYTYEGEKYTASCFACGKLDIHVEYPPNEPKSRQIVTRRLTAGWIAVISSFVFAVAMCFAKVTWLWPLPLVLLLGMVCLDACKENQLKAIIAARIKKALEKNNLSAMTTDEKNFSVFMPTTPTAAFVTAFVLTGILIIFSLVYGGIIRSEKLHAADQINIAVVSKSEEYKEEYQYYKNGCYLIHLGYQVEADEIGVEWIDVAIYVSDKNGNQLGVINSDINNTIEAGEEKTITTTLGESNPDSNAFFVQLYNADLDDLEFDVKIKSIKFEDGKYYTNND